MTKLEKFTSMMEAYLGRNGFDTELASDISTTSRNTETGVSLCSSSMRVIDMDRFARQGYRKIILPVSETEDDSINTADAFMINRNNEWYFVEFKDAKLGNSKQSILKKAYSNLYAVLDVLYEMKKEKEAYPDFPYEDPIHFIQEHVTYILVFSGAKNPLDAEQMLNYIKIRKKYLPIFMKRLQGYIYKEAYAVTEDEFVKNFLTHFYYV